MSIELVVIAIAAVVAAIMLLSLVSGSWRPIAVLPDWVHEAGHLAFYALLALLCVLGLQSAGLSAVPRLALGIGLPTALGALMEWLQSFRPGRSASLRDVAIDAAGAACGAAVAVVLL